MLKIVPVCGGGSVLNVAGSCCGRAGLRLRLMILVFLTFCTVPSVGAASSAEVLVVVSAPSAAAGCDRSSNATAGAASVGIVSTSAMICRYCVLLGGVQRNPVRKLWRWCGLTTHEKLDIRF